MSGRVIYAVLRLRCGEARLSSIPAGHLDIQKSGRKLLPARLNFRGGDDGIRTHDPHVANVMLSQLSYIPTGLCAFARGLILPVMGAFVK